MVWKRQKLLVHSQNTKGYRTRLNMEALVSCMPISEHVFFCPCKTHRPKLESCFQSTLVFREGEPQVTEHETLFTSKGDACCHD